MGCACGEVWRECGGEFEGCEVVGEFGCLSFNEGDGKWVYIGGVGHISSITWPVVGVFTKMSRSTRV